MAAPQAPPMANTKLFQPVKVGNSQLEHRIALAPLTRLRADDSHVPLDMVQTHYEQRACVPGTLLVTEATFISARAGGMPNVPGIYNQAQIDAWKKVTDKVHAKKGTIYLQLWALGRAANKDAIEGEGHKVVSASDVAFEGGAKPAPLTEEEIKSFIQDYAQAAKNAIEAGFDGVEIHGANGYLIDQFLQTLSNKRTDQWGGSVENRSRFALEVAKAVVAAVGAERTAIRLSPYSDFQGMHMPDSELVPQFTHVVTELRKLNLAYLHLTEARVSGNATVETDASLVWIMDIWNNLSPVLVAGGYTPESAKEAIEGEYKNHDVIIVFGRYFISNPDLVDRVKRGIAFRPYDRRLFYNAKQENGYITYEADEGFSSKI